MRDRTTKLSSRSVAHIKVGHGPMRRTLRLRGAAQLLPCHSENLLGEGTATSLAHENRLKVKRPTDRITVQDSPAGVERVERSVAGA